MSNQAFSSASEKIISKSFMIYTLVIASSAAKKPLDKPKPLAHSEQKKIIGNNCRLFWKDLDGYLK
jgi:hypothetical protein